MWLLLLLHGCGRGFCACPLCCADPCLRLLHCRRAGAALAQLLGAHPNLLTYSVSADGKRLEKGPARASVDVVQRGDKRAAGVSYWREGAAFAGAPVAPYKPSPL